MIIINTMEQLGKYTDDGGVDLEWKNDQGMGWVHIDHPENGLDIETITSLAEEVERENIRINPHTIPLDEECTSNS